MITAAAITWTLITCLHRPFGRPFKVTDKGGDRGRIVIRWRLLAFFGGLTVVSVAAILLALLGPDSSSEPSSLDQLNLIWAGVTAVLCAIASLVCIERPRRHREELFQSDLSGRFLFEDVNAECRVRHLSTSGLALHTDRPLLAASQAVGGDVSVWVEGIGVLVGVIVRAKRREITVGLSLSESRRRDLVRHLYRTPNDNVALEARLGPAWRGVLRSGLGRV